MGASREIASKPIDLSVGVYLNKKCGEKVAKGDILYTIYSNDEEARKAIKKCRIYKSFQFSLHGWMDFHTAVFEVKNNNIDTNRSGKCVKGILKNVLFQEKRRRVI